MNIRRAFDWIIDPLSKNYAHIVKNKHTNNNENYTKSEPSKHIEHK